MKLVVGNIIRLNGDPMQIYRVQCHSLDGESSLFTCRCYQAEVLNDREQSADLDEHDLAYLFGVDEMPPFEVFKDHAAYMQYLMDNWKY